MNHKSFVSVLKRSQSRLAQIDGRRLLLIASITFFAFALLYTSWRTNYYASTIQDALLYPYLFKSYSLHDIIVPAQHANILKYPLFMLQALLPYNFATFTMITIGLTVISIVWWALLLVYIFGKKYAALIFTLLASILTTSVIFNINFTETTIRNIEYPIGLTFFFVVYRIYKNRRLSRKTLVWASIITLLFTLSIAGDSFMVFGFVVPLIATLFVMYVVNPKKPGRLLTPFLLVMGTLLAAIIIRKALSHVGLVSYFFNGDFGLRLTTSDQIGPATTHSLLQYIDLMGGNIFGLTLDRHWALNIFCLGLAITSLIGLVYMARQGVHMLRANISEKVGFIYVVLFLSFFFTALSYIVSGHVMSKLVSGVFVDAGQIRYITLLPLIGVAGVVFLCAHHFPRHKFEIIIPLTIILLSISSIQVIRASWGNFHSSSVDNRQTIQSVVTTLRAEKVRSVISGDSLGAPIRFWSGDTINYRSTIKCGLRFPYNTRRSWDDMNITGKSALVVDRTGMDAQYWEKCTDQQLTKNFGTPDAKILVPTSREGQPIVLWVYTHGVLRKMPWSPT